MSWLNKYISGHRIPTIFDHFFAVFRQFLPAILIHKQRYNIKSGNIDQALVRNF